MYRISLAKTSALPKGSYFFWVLKGKANIVTMLAKISKNLKLSFKVNTARGGIKTRSFAPLGMLHTLGQ